MIILGLHATNADHKCDYFSILWAPRSAKLSGKVLSGIVGRWRSQRCIIHPSSDEVDHKAHESLLASKKKGGAKLWTWTSAAWQNFKLPKYGFERKWIWARCGFEESLDLNKIWTSTKRRFEHRMDLSKAWAWIKPSIWNDFKKNHQIVTRLKPFLNL